MLEFPLVFITQLPSCHVQKEDRKTLGKKAKNIEACLKDSQIVLQDPQYQGFFFSFVFFFLIGIPWWSSG